MHRARATASFGPKARAARRRSVLARTKSPSCAMAMPRSASAGASPRKATRFNAPSGSPAASARPAAVIRESTGIPSHLSLPADRPHRIQATRRPASAKSHEAASGRDGNPQGAYRAQEESVMVDIPHRVGIKSSLDNTYKALATREGIAAWWTNKAQGESKVGGTLQFRFG